jgi:alpha-mannosidase
VSQILRVPKSASADRQSRSEELVDMPIVSHISLSCGAKRVDITTEIENRAEDHRVRVLFPSGISTEYSYAEGHYDVVKRKIELPDPNAYSLEKPAATHPQRSFVDVSDGDVGLAVINQGLPEYEVKNDACRTIALTLLRGVNFISQNDLLTRPGGNAGWPYETPGGQCLGKHTFHYAIAPHSGNWQDAGLHREAHTHNTPCRAEQTDSHPGPLPHSMSFVSISPASLMITAIKKADAEEALIVRCYNVSDEEVTGELQTFQAIKRAELTNLNEETQKELPMRSENRVPITARPWEIKTIRLTF